MDLAEKSVRRLARADEKDRAKDTVALMILTNQHEIDHAIGSSYADLFKGTDRRRTEISVLAWMMQCELQLIEADGSAFGSVFCRQLDLLLPASGDGN